MFILGDPQVDALLTRLDELVRWRPGMQGLYLDPHSSLARIQGAANHVILGRRGSGKTRLLDEFTRTASEETYVVSFGAEDYKELTYPDILIQILRSFLREFQLILSHRPIFISSEWWTRSIASIQHPIQAHSNRRTRASLNREVTTLAERLSQLLSESDELEAEYVESKSSAAHTKDQASAAIGGSKAKLAASSEMASETSEATERRARQRELKAVKVERLLGDFKNLLKGVCEYLNARLVLAVDDFYFIRREDQPPVIDYIHRICKDTNAFVKVATIRHRTQLYDRGEVSRGVVPGHEIQPIDLEVPLGRFDGVRRFLESIWRAVCDEVRITTPQGLFMGDGFRQAVLASGGVPRDFFGVVRTAIGIARDRGEEAVGKLRVNEAARQYTEDTKLPEIKVDAATDEGLRDLLLLDLIRFARDLRRKNCLHVDINRLRQEPVMQSLFDALVDARLLHLITDNTSNARRKGRYAAYLLDVGLYAHPQRRGDRAVEEVEFWERDEAGRLKNLERSPVYPLRSISELKEVARRVHIEESQLREMMFPRDEGAQDLSGTIASPDVKKANVFAQLEFDFPPLAGEEDMPELSAH